MAKMEDDRKRMPPSPLSKSSPGEGAKIHEEILTSLKSKRPPDEPDFDESESSAASAMVGLSETFDTRNHHEEAMKAVEMKVDVENSSGGGDGSGSSGGTDGGGENAGGKNAGGKSSTESSSVTNWLNSLLDADNSSEEAAESKARPKGRAPKGKVWDAAAGEWVDKPKRSGTKGSAAPVTRRRTRLSRRVEEPMDLDRPADDTSMESID